MDGKVYSFGNEYTNTHAAALRLYGRVDEEFSSVRQMLQRVKTDEGAVAVAPIENSAEGTVTETLDSVRESGLFITQEIVLPIHHRLIGLTGARLEDVRTVYSHPQALNQCRAFLQREMPKASLQAVAYTGAGLDMLTGLDCACIAPAPKAGQAVLRESIEDSAANATRFVSVRAAPTGKGDKAAIVFGTPNAPGALLSALQILAQMRLNMTKIESRPNREGMGGYIFYVDFEFDGTAKTLRGVLDALGAATHDLRFLGQIERIPAG